MRRRRVPPLHVESSSSPGSSQFFPLLLLLHPYFPCCYVCARDGNTPCSHSSSVCVCVYASILVCIIERCNVARELSVVQSTCEGNSRFLIFFCNKLSAVLWSEDRKQHAGRTNIFSVTVKHTVIVLHFCTFVFRFLCIFKITLIPLILWNYAFTGLWIQSAH